MIQYNESAIYINPNGTLVTVQEGLNPLVIFRYWCLWINYYYLLMLSIYDLFNILCLLNFLPLTISLSSNHNLMEDLSHVLACNVFPWSSVFVAMTLDKTRWYYLWSIKQYYFIVIRSSDPNLIFCGIGNSWFPWTNPHILWFSRWILP